MLRLPHFIVAPEIVELFGGGGATRSLLAETYGAYPCAVCGRTGQLDTDTPAAVVVTIYDHGMGPLVVRLAHPGCSTSGVVLVLHAPAPTGQLTVPAMAWLREGDPPSVVVVAPRVSARNIAGGGDLTDVILSGLLATGFTLLTEPDTTLDVVPGRVHVTFGTGQRITVTTSEGATLYDGTLPVPDGWAELIQHTGLLGIVVVRGLDLLDPDRDHLADLHAAIRRGTAVGIAVQVDPRPRPEPTQPALPPPTQPALPPTNRKRETIMTQPNLTPAATAVLRGGDPTLTDRADPTLTDLSALTDPGLADLSDPTSPSDVDEHDRVRPGPSLGGLPGGSPVRETPSEPPPANHPTAQLSPPDGLIRDRGD